MRDATGLFTEEEKLAGYIETDTGTILVSDGLWEDRLPLSSQSRLTLDLGIERCRIPAYAVLRNEKRYLILSIDDAILASSDVENVETEGQVIIPKSEDEKREEEETAARQEDDNG